MTTKFPKRWEDKLFVYGIFLDQSNREAYGMSNPRYATVKGYATVAKYGNIVEAVDFGIDTIALTGLTVDVDPTYWASLDRLEGGYDRIEVATSNGNAWMYAARSLDENAE